MPEPKEGRPADTEEIKDRVAKQLMLIIYLLTMLVAYTIALAYDIDDVLKRTKEGEVVSFYRSGTLTIARIEFWLVSHRSIS
jgi:hypothetical protein